MQKKVGLLYFKLVTSRKKNFLQIRLYFTSSKMSDFQIEVMKKLRQLRIFIFGWFIISLCYLTLCLQVKKFDCDEIEELKKASISHNCWHNLMLVFLSKC